jgi:cytidylate kinase
LPAIREQIETRDRRDSARAHSPLAPAPDAELVDTTGQSVDTLVTRLLQRVLERAKA